MTQSVVRGHAITLELIVTDGDGNAVSPTTPRISISDPNGSTILTNAVPTEVSTGILQYTYTVDADATPGGYGVVWTAILDGDPYDADDAFTVRIASALTPAGATGEVCTPWATHDDVITTDTITDTDLLDVKCAIASDILYELSGKRWPGVCNDTIRPNALWRKLESIPQWFAAEYPTAPYGWCTCNRPRETGCNLISEIKLNGSPVDVASVTVRVDGVAYTAADGIFRIDDGHWLVRTDDEGWPCCQDMRADPATDEHTFEVSYAFGTLPPVGGVHAAAQLGYELYLAQTGSSACKLPKRIQTISRQGTTVTFIDRFKEFSEGRTGIPEVDLWLSSLIVGQKRRRANVLVPGVSRPARRTAS